MRVPRASHRLTRSTLPFRHRRLAGLPATMLIVSLALGGGLAGCADSEGAGAPAATTGSTGAPPPPPEAAVPIGHMYMPTSEEVSTTWAGRPAYVKALPIDWQGAYAYALARPDVLQWLPCYCGCNGMGHRSNLDCFFQRREEKGFYAWEEHASYCDICVQAANMAGEMLRHGSTMVQIRDAVDARWSGGSAPGTDTPRPPA